MKKLIITFAVLNLISNNLLGQHQTNLNDSERVKRINVNVQLQFSLFDIEGHPLSGKLKKYYDDYVSKNKSDKVPPTLKPTPIIYDKVIDLNSFYKKIIEQEELTISNFNDRDTIELLCYINSKGKVTSGYALLSEPDELSKKITAETSNIELWSPAYFNDVPGDVKTLISINYCG